MERLTERDGQCRVLSRVADGRGWGLKYGHSLGHSASYRGNRVRYQLSVTPGWPLTARPWDCPGFLVLPPMVCGGGLPFMRGALSQDEPEQSCPQDAGSGASQHGGLFWLGFWQHRAGPHVLAGGVALEASGNTSRARHAKCPFLVLKVRSKWRPCPLSPQRPPFRACPPLSPRRLSSLPPLYQPSLQTSRRSQSPQLPPHLLLPHPSSLWSLLRRLSSR